MAHVFVIQSLPPLARQVVFKWLLKGSLSPLQEVPPEEAKQVFQPVFVTGFLSLKLDLCPFMGF